MSLPVRVKELAAAWLQREPSPEPRNFARAFHDVVLDARDPDLIVRRDQVVLASHPCVNAQPSSFHIYPEFGSWHG